MQENPKLQKQLAQADDDPEDDDRYSVVPFRRKYFNDELFDQIGRDIQRAKDYYNPDDSGDSKQHCILIHFKIRSTFKKDVVQYHAPMQ